MARILIADDDPMIIRLLEIKISQQGYDVITAEDGLQALDTALDQLPDLIVLDGMMPGLDGLEVLRRLRQNPATENTPIILLTARDQLEDVEEALSSGASTYLVKPVNPQDLIATIDGYLTS